MCRLFPAGRCASLILNHCVAFVVTTWTERQSLCVLFFHSAVEAMSSGTKTFKSNHVAVVEPKCGAFIPAPQEENEARCLNCCLSSCCASHRTVQQFWRLDISTLQRRPVRHYLQAMRCQRGPLSANTADGRGENAAVHCSKTELLNRNRIAAMEIALGLSRCSKREVRRAMAERLPTGWSSETALYDK
ncbi:hypothetical protein BJ546DRAFT_955927 [Cryomyces antarcticus]